MTAQEVAAVCVAANVPIVLRAGENTCDTPGFCVTVMKDLTEAYPDRRITMLDRKGVAVCEFVPQPG